MKNDLKIFVTYFLVLSAAILTIGYVTPADSIKVPAEIGVRIKSVLLDQARTQNRMSQTQLQWLQSPQGLQFVQDQKTVQSDQDELEKLKKEAMQTAKVDALTHDVDVEKLEFIDKPQTKK